MSGTLFIISAASGTGKTSLIKELFSSTPKVQVSISHTTRPIRPGEKKGVNYHFIDQNTFKEMLSQNMFLEHAEVFGNWYGTSKTWVNDTLQQHQDVILEIDWQGAQQIRKQLPNTISIFIVPPSLETLKKRLQSRQQDSDEVIERRLSAAKEEISHYPEYDYLVVNDDFNKAVSEVKHIILSTRNKNPVAAENQEQLLTNLLS